MLAIWILFGVATVLQLGYWLGIFARFPGYIAPVPTVGSEPASVVICAYNEADNLKKNLPHFLDQAYAKKEILVVDDHSTDNSAQIVLDFKNICRTLHLVSLSQPPRPGKKTALREGIHRASYETIILSDADCRPASQHWLGLMQGSLQPPCEIVLGYGPYERKPGLLNSFVRFETIYTAIQYFSFAIIGLPYMGVGRNLAYRRSLFLTQNGFARHEHLLSGDDDLFVNGAAHAQNIALMLHPDAFVYSEPVTTWSGYYHQKKRHLSVGRHYRRLHQWMLGGLSASHAAFYLSGFALAILAPHTWPYLMITYMVRMGVVLWVWAGATRRLHERGIWQWVPLLDLLFLAYYFCFAPALFTGRSVKRWK